MLGDAERPADDGALRRGVGVRHLADDVRGHAGFRLAFLQGPRLDQLAILLETRRRMLDEVAVGQLAGDDLARHRVRERDVGADVEAGPHVGPLRGGGPPRIDRVELGPTLHALEQVVKEDRVRLPGVRSPEEDAIGLFNLAVRARSTAHAECRRQTGDARGMSSTVAAVEVVRAHHDSREFLRGVVHLVRALRAAEQPEGLAAVLVTNGGKPFAARSSASSHVACLSEPPRTSRTRGWTMRVLPLMRSL